jgi:hypothetical protein
VPQTPSTTLSWALAASAGPTSSSSINQTIRLVLWNSRNNLIVAYDEYAEFTAIQ